MNVLLVDIGNSRIKARVADLAVDPAVEGPETGWLGPTRVADSADPERALDQLAEVSAIGAVVVSNVAGVRPANVVVDAVAARWPDAVVRHVVAERARCGVVNGYRQPEKLGPDRWMALVGARSLLVGHSVLVCSFGTATTIDLLVATATGGDATFVGGLILPGFEAMDRALSAATARLPRDARHAAGPTRAFADRTEDAMWSGVVAAQLGAVERSMRLARARLSSLEDAGPLQCVLTGGHAATVAPVLLEIDEAPLLIPGLVLQGMRRWAGDTLAGGTVDRPMSAVTS